MTTRSPSLVLYLTQEQHLVLTNAGAVVAAIGAGGIASQLLGGRRRTMLVGFLGTAAATWSAGAVFGPPAGTVLLDHAGRTTLGAAGAMQADAPPCC